MGEEADYQIENELAEQWHGGQEPTEPEYPFPEEFKLKPEFREGGKYARKTRE